jgi:oxygen-independent coproporphyrinogen-3 oxidase
VDTAGSGQQAATARHSFRAREPLGLYVHVPFCAAICNYCNFNRGLFDAALKARYVAALISHIACDGDGARADTIYFGGGTPSLLAPAEVGAVIGACRRAFDVDPDAEVTLEANPETVTRPLLEEFRRHGVNRLSLGVQSFRDEELIRLGRLHDARRAREALRDARASGFDNVSLDLMMWLPMQTRGHWRESLDGLIDAAPEHASLYLLELYPNAPLKEDMARAGWSQAPDDDAADMYLESLDRLESAGYRQYEISNVAVAGRESRHNLKYWSDGEWMAFGCGAHGTRNGVRWKQVSSTTDYVLLIEAGADTRVEVRTLSERDRAAEALITGLRLASGLDLSVFPRRYGIDVLAEWGSGIERAIAAGALVLEGDRFRLTRHGMLIANEVLACFV